MKVSRKYYKVGLKLRCYELSLIIYDHILAEVMRKLAKERVKMGEMTQVHFEGIGPLRTKTPARIL